MNDYMISMFIDDELDLDDKVEFVERVHTDKPFKDEAIELLRQEKLIRSEVVDQVPQLELKVRKRLPRSWLRSVGMAASALAAAAVLVFLFMPSQVSTTSPYRFVIHRPDAREVEITGSFNDWTRIPMTRTGGRGYWEITLDLPKGEHRFAYIVESRQRIPDPTIPTQEEDDFGGKNSVLVVNRTT
jgi:hypothetical protein